MGWGALGRYTKVSSKIVDSESWKTELMYLAQEAEQDGRTENAIAYYRMSEFFMYDGDPDKISVYKKQLLYSTTTTLNISQMELYKFFMYHMKISPYL